jgi:Protein of unknown function (DUF1186)
MNINGALGRFTDGQRVPREAIRWALNHWDDVSPRLLARLFAFSIDRNSGIPATEIFYVAHLCAEKGEAGAFAPLCRMVANDPAIDRWLGDAVTETLPGILVNVFDHDVELLQHAIESPTGYAFARASALAALGYLVRAKAVMSDADMHAYLRRLRRTMKPRGESIVWMSWATCAANLGYADLRPDVVCLDLEDLIPERDFNPELFDQRIRLVRRDRAGLAGFHADLIRPMNNAIDAIEALDHVGEFAYAS